MTRPGARPPSQRNIQLIESLLDGTIDTSKFEQLTEILAEDSQSLSTFVEYANLHSALRQHYLSHAVVPDGSLDLQIAADVRTVLTNGNTPTKSKLRRYFLNSIAAILLVGSALLLLPSTTDETSQLAEQTNPVSPPTLPTSAAVEHVAVLTRLVDVVWQNDANSANVGMALPRQELKIKSGLMQIEFYCGAAVIVEGPAAFELLAADRGYAHYGKLRAHVPPRATGFSIGTKSGNVVDLGTEFGLKITEDGKSELHVIDGEVDFHDAKNSNDPPRRLTGGQAIEVLSSGKPPRLIDSDSSRFVNYAELSARAHQRTESRQQRWQNLHRRLQTDPSLVADYVFDDFQDWGRTLVNSAPGADERSFGAIVGASWKRGRWPGSKALSFRSPSDRVRIMVEGEFESLSLATWVNLERMQGARAIALLHPEIDYQRNAPNNKQRFIHWTLNPTPGGAVLHFSESFGHSTRDRNHYSSVSHGVRRLDLGNWVHLAVVYDRDALQVSHFKNGELVGSMPIESPRKISIGIADLGNWPYKGWAAGTQFEFRNFTGLMDEFVILGRALSTEEVLEMYEIGRP